MTSHDAMYCMTVIMCLFIVQKRKENQNKRKEKSNQNKISEFKHTVTSKIREKIEILEKNQSRK